MKRTAVLSIAMLLFVIACEDKPEIPRSSLTGPSASLTASVGAPSTVCVAYGKELESAGAEAAAHPDEAGVQQRVDALSAVIADACR